MGFDRRRSRNSDAAASARIRRAPKLHLPDLPRDVSKLPGVSAPSIYGAASIFLTARRGGHSVAVCEKHYAGAVKNISPDARSLEAAMQIEAEAAQVIASIASPAGRLRAV